MKTKFQQSLHSWNTKNSLATAVEGVKEVRGPASGQTKSWPNQHSVFA